MQVDASDYQLGGAILQDNKPVAFHSRTFSTTQHQHAGHSLPRDVQAQPWHTLYVDLIGPHTVQESYGLVYTLKTMMTFANPATGWFKIVEIPDKKAVIAANLLDVIWLCRCSRPVVLIYDNSKEFQEMLASYGTHGIPTTAQNPQANFVKHIHLTLSNILQNLIRILGNTRIRLESD